ncbi:MAG: pseudouridine synthase [Bacteroidota bacterium]|nr:pseudouridine synthase [Bacteroidota bacterium]
MRLLKYLTKCDVASRRKCDKLILGGHILVDGKVVNKPFVNIIPGENTVKVNGKICSPTENYYLMLNKPPGYTCSLKDEHAEKLAVDLITLEDKNIRLFSVGRLDKDSEGLILFTNDGDFANNIGHPSKGVVKTYKVSVRGELTRTVIKKIQFGIFRTSVAMAIWVSGGVPTITRSKTSAATSCGAANLILSSQAP